MHTTQCPVVSKNFWATLTEAGVYVEVRGFSLAYDYDENNQLDVTAVENLYTPDFFALHVILDEEIVWHSDYFSFQKAVEAAEKLH